MGSDRRVLALFVALAVLGLPAFTLRVLCVGHGCDEPVEATADVPFCSLRRDVRTLVAAGFREERSPGVLGVTSKVIVGGGDAFARTNSKPQWPSIEPIPREVPLVFRSHGLRPDELPGGIGLDDVAPSIAALMGIERPHPEVRSGMAIAGVQTTAPSPLVVQIVWKGVGTAELQEAPEAWRELSALADEGMATFTARVPSLPLDPAAVLTTIGTGALPAQHGVTGTLLRNDHGRVVKAWGTDAPGSVIAAVGDDLDDLTDQEARIGLIASDPTDRGLIGKDWYVDTDRDDLALATETTEVVRHAHAWLENGYGNDRVPDLLSVSLSGSIDEMDRTTGALVKAVEEAVEEAAVVVTASGSSVRFADLDGEEIAGEVESILGSDRSVVQAATPGGLFLDQRVIADRGIADDRILEAMSNVRDIAGRRAFADVFPAIAVSFGRFC